MGSRDFNPEQDSLLNRMASQPNPGGLWPEGCYGSRLAWITFVGPSPGGSDNTSVNVHQRNRTVTPLWNQDFKEPIEEWSNGFKNTGILVETIMERTAARGALKLYNVVNFDWVKTPNASNVPGRQMRRGSRDVMDLLDEIQPRVIIPMTIKTNQLLSSLLRRTYTLQQLIAQVKIRISPNRYHCSIDAYKIVGSGPLDGKFLIRSLQHPARIYNRFYAGRIAHTIRSALCAMADGITPISISIP